MATTFKVTKKKLHDLANIGRKIEGDTLEMLE
jgi:hypothetical protein